MSAEAYFDMDQEEPISLGLDPVEIDAFLDRVENEAVTAEVAVMAQIEWVDSDGSPVLQFGMAPGTRSGFVGHIGATSSALSRGDSARAGTVAYDYMGNERVVPKSAEIDLAAVRRAVHRFVVERGARDDGVAWQELE
ncbi:Imm1 family immunity protein [Actinokineospora sp. G85]|uniref:Imm1 family immunity protein n=1 Tax=Actinokineospora sp. G85 TaxID=3406626 RepID=UPI003C76151F